MDCNHKLSFRKAVESDRELLLEWANEKETRRQSFQGHQILPDEHARWFENVLRSEHTVLLILCLGELPVGNMRFLIDDTCATLSYSISCRYRGCGFGKELIKLAITYAKTNLGVSVLRAETKTDNIASQKVLLENGFQITGKLPEQGGIVFSKKLEGRTCL